MNEAAERSKSAETSGEGAFERFCAAGRPLTVFAVPAGIVFLAVHTTEPIFEYFVKRKIASHEFYPPVSIFTMNTLTNIDHYWYHIAFVLPMLVASILGFRSFRPMLLGHLNIAQLLGVAILVPPSLIVVSGVIGIGIFSFPHLAAIERTSLRDYATAFVVAPFTEELFFQVALQTNLQRFGWFVAIVGTTLPFLYIHLDSLGFDKLVIYAVPALTAFAVIRQTTKSFGAALLTHACCNVLSMFLRSGYYV